MSDTGEFEWGGPNTGKGMRDLKKDDHVFAYQTDSKELFGLCLVTGIKREGIYFKWDGPRYDPRPKVSAIKEANRLIKKSTAFRGGFPKTIYPLTEREAKTLRSAAAAAAQSQLKTGADRHEGHYSAHDKRNGIASRPTNNPDQDAKAREREFLEGQKRTVTAVERNPQLRIEAKKKYGLKCYCCGFDFQRFYGDIAAGMAIVHHLTPFGKKRRKVAVKQVRVVCANCHQIIHVHRKPIDIKELKKRISKRWTRWSEHGIQSK